MRYSRASDSSVSIGVSMIIVLLRPPAPGRAVEAARKVVVSVEDAEAVTNWFPRTAGAAVTKLTLDMDTRAVHQITAPRSAKRFRKCNIKWRSLKWRSRGP